MKPPVERATRTTLRARSARDITAGAPLASHSTPKKGHREHTARHFRRELWFPTLLDRQYYQGCLEGGALSTEERYRQRKEQILRRHQPEPVSPELKHVLDEIVHAARHELGRL
jgi:trimethylamine:corrinoid methyltransferase-like protein